MSKVMHITSYCDNKTRHGETQVPAQHQDLVASVGETGKRVIDLCDDASCYGMFERFVVLLAHGSPVDSKDEDSGDDRRARDLPRLCPEDGKVLGSRSSLGQHLSSTHNKRFRDYPNHLKHTTDYQGLPYHY